MSTSVLPPAPPSESPPSRRDARRQAKVDLATAKAKAKAQRPFWRKPWVWVLGIIAIVIIASVAASQGSKAPSGAQPGTSGAAKTSTPGIGQAALDGQFTFTVRSFSCGTTTIGAGILAATAQGQFCVANVTVLNHGQEAQTLDSSSQFAFIGSKKYSTSTDALTASPQAEKFFLQEINPGNSVSGIVVFDVPKGQSPDRLELHDSPFSDGVTVTVS
jgi:Domain of unknown function (DUF4352)